VLNELRTATGVERMCLVAHSMGGVVTRRALALHAADRPGPFIGGLVTIASPLGGHPGAGAGVAMSPLVIPAWRGLVPSGPFIRELFATPLPDEIRYALFFAFEDASGDGVVPLSSQLRREAASEADLVRGFVGTHVGVLHQEATSRALAEELDRCRGN
jgi:pimeloyl-ACP methyl ester carboxylesterase